MSIVYLLHDVHGILELLTRRSSSRDPSIVSVFVPALRKRSTSSRISGTNRRNVPLNEGDTTGRTPDKPQDCDGGTQPLRGSHMFVGPILGLSCNI